MTEITATGPWSGFKYQPISAIADKVVARRLRYARKHMLRFFQERGLFDFIVRLERIIKSPRLNMMQKNVAFQKVLDDYAKQVVPNDRREAPQPAAEAAPVVQVGEVAVRDEGGSDLDKGPRADTASGVSVLAAEADGV